MNKLIVIVLSFLMCPLAEAAVAYISDADDVNPGATSTSVFTSFAVSGTNPAILIVIAMRATSVSSVVLSAGLTSGTPYLVKTQTNGNTTMEIWAIPAPTGTGTITVTLGTAATHQTNAILVQGADQTTPAPIADSASTTGSTSPLTVSPTNLTANDAVIYGGGQTDSGDAPLVADTQTFIGNSGTTNMSAGYRLGTGSVSVSWGIAAPTEVVVAARVQEPTTGAVIIPSILGDGIITGQQF